MQGDHNKAGIRSSLESQRLGSIDIYTSPDLLLNKPLSVTRPWPWLVLDD
jgi:hypothetical protein